MVGLLLEKGPQGPQGPKGPKGSEIRLKTHPPPITRRNYPPQSPTPITPPFRPAFFPIQPPVGNLC
jgi:hypothetical protein